MDSSLFSPIGIPVCFNFTLWVAPPPSKPEFEQKCKQLHGATTVQCFSFIAICRVPMCIDRKRQKKNWIPCYNSWAWKWLNTNVTNQNRLSHPKNILTWLGTDTCDHNILSMRNSFSTESAFHFDVSLMSNFDRLLSFFAM